LHQEREENRAKLAVASGDLGRVHGIRLLVGSGGEFLVGKNQKRRGKDAAAVANEGEEEEHLGLRGMLYRREGEGEV
jgi:hypothetical protein